MKVSIWTKIVCALIEYPKTFCKTKSPRLIMTLLVKNEEDILEENLCFHKLMGVDAFIITNNNSTDKTSLIIDKYKKKGWVVEVINEPAINYEQKAWVDCMVWKAKEIFKADWIINADADEFWYSPTGNLKDELRNASANVLCCKVKSMYPDENKPFYEWQWAVKPILHPEKYTLSKYSLFEHQNSKVIHRANGYLQISMGNHKVSMFPYKIKPSNVCVYHYNIRGKLHFLTKMVNGGKQLEKHKGKHGGRHWRYFYDLYKKGLLEKEYDKVIGKEYYGEFCKNGVIYKDTTIKDFIKKYYCDGRCFYHR